VLAIVQENGSEFSWKKLARTLRPDNFVRKAWRWLRDRRRYTGNKEGEFFFGDGSARLTTRNWCGNFPISTTRTW
jgi:methionyl-tRNA formyltransferase